jgi:hypothetical protein
MFPADYYHFGDDGEDASDNNRLDIYKLVVVMGWRRASNVKT